MIDLKKDINFRYVFGKNEEKNRMALAAMIQAFIGEKVEHLKIQSSELKMDMENAKETRMDILAEYSTHSEPHRPALRATYSII